MSQFGHPMQAKTSHSIFGVSVRSHPRPKVAGHLAQRVFRGWRPVRFTFVESHPKEESGGSTLPSFLIHSSFVSASLTSV
jgi:hypothetical protein